MVTDSPDYDGNTDGNTELATDDDNDYAPVSSRKRPAGKPPSGGVRYVVSIARLLYSRLHFSSPGLNGLEQ